MFDKVFMRRKAMLFEHVSHDAFFEKLSHELVDYGCDIRFSVLGGAGAYKPFALATERLDTAEKQALFTQGFMSMSVSGALKAVITLHLLSGQAQQTHSLMHEMMHFYQDMLGLYFLPLQEKGVFPVMPDARSMVRIILFNEAWAEVETIRAAWAMNRRGQDMAWRGALKSKDWSALARSYDDDLASGVDEAKAAANLVVRWYESSQRAFYERHALRVFDVQFEKFKSGVDGDSDFSAQFRRVDIQDMIARIPQNETPSYFSQINWEESLFRDVQSRQASDVLKSGAYIVSENKSVGDIRHGAPPYLWRQLRIQEVNNPDVPAQMLKSNDD